jgi:hypothetical protein
MEAICSGDEGKEVVYAAPSEQYAHYEDGEKFPVQPQGDKKPRRRICGLGIPLLLALIIFLLIALAVGLGVGLGVGLKKRYVIEHLRHLHRP